MKTRGAEKRTMKCKRYTCDPERIEKGGRRLKIPFPNECTSSRQNATSMSDGEDKPHKRDDRVLFRTANRYVKKNADTKQGYKKEKPAKRRKTGGWVVFLESGRNNGENSIWCIPYEIQNADKKGDHILATSGEDITAVRVLTFPKVRMPVHGEGIGSTRAFIFKRNIM